MFLRLEWDRYTRKGRMVYVSKKPALMHGLLTLSIYRQLMIVQSTVAARS
jgi:hypothetical protein